MFRKLLKFCFVLILTPFILAAVFLLALYAIIRGPDSLNGLLRWLGTMNTHCDKKIAGLEREKAGLQGEEMLKQWASERKNQ